MWKKLETMYERKNAQSKAFTIRKLVNLKYKDGGSVAEHLTTFQNLVNQVTSMGIKIEDELQALFLLSSLPDSWETLVITISNPDPDGKVALQTFKDSMFNEESRRKDMGTNSGHALVVENRGRDRGKSYGPRGRNKSRDKSRDKGRSKFR